jgi:uncharacterized protein YbjT (DUF2867 family)
VILVTQPVLSQELNVIDSAGRAGIEHVVKVTNKADAHSPIARRRIQSEIEDALFASGLSYTLLCNNAYMQNFLMTAAGIAQTSSFRTATGDGRVGHLDVRDVAAGAAEIAVSPAGHAGKRYWPTGPDSLSGYDVAEIFTEVLGRLITFHPISYEIQKQAMIDVGLPEPVAGDNALAVAWMADGDCDYVTGDVPQILGRPDGSFEQFAIGYAEALSERFGGDGVTRRAQSPTAGHEQRLRHQEGTSQQKGHAMTTNTETTSRTKHLLELMAYGDRLFNARDWQALDAVHAPDMIAFIPRERGADLRTEGTRRGDATAGPDFSRRPRASPVPDPVRRRRLDHRGHQRHRDVHRRDDPARRQSRSADRKSVRPRIRLDQQVAGRPAHPHFRLLGLRPSEAADRPRLAAKDAGQIAGTTILASAQLPALGRT